ncbi:MAG: hypothetical protein CSA38_01705 [Flavobacteriales bacterium]|nr:MAG: hypothetical protein CSA38_01705 [Flavobacteriales bacterium]
MKKIVFLFTLALISVFSNKMKAQSKYTTHTLIHAGYTYQNHHFGEVGAKFLFLKNDNFLYRLGGSALLGKVDKKFTVIPKIQADILVNTRKEVDIAHGYYFLAGADFSTHYIAPKLGVSLFGITDFNVGYAFPIRHRNSPQALEGLQFQFLINIPTVIF